ncbi:DUF262 domain-containing protein [Hyphomonas sp.]|uniref:DUF262 domain-containing protein n=1 Tax=Hyphomonas sp. TaxID=87 RepID=UPI0030FAA7C4
MGFNNEIQPYRANISELVTRLRASEFYVDRSFQRRLVWTDKQKVRLIETVLIEYPMPEIYLWEKAPDPDTGQQKFSIVDGQQRLSTLRQFLNNEWPLKKSYLDAERRGADFADRYWKDLSAAQKTQIYQYNINGRRIPSDVPEQQIRRIFARLNETDRSLNPQEMRNATFNGAFLEASIKVAECDEMKALKIFSLNHVRRMLDVEFASQLLGFERLGIASDTPESMNELYDKYSGQYRKAKSDIQNVRASLKLIAEIFGDTNVREMFESQNNIYTLHSLFEVEPAREVATWQKVLSAFANEYKATAKAAADEAVDENISEFRKGASSRTRSASSRLQRVVGLRSWIRTYLGEPIKEG